ncbi:hypothetical protein BGZ51_000751, partial [Haplosporangium sp. Z 767]
SQTIRSPPEDVEDLYVVDDDKPRLVSEIRPAIESTPEFIRQKEQFLELIEPLLAANEAIDPTSYCDHPMMKVELKVQPGTIVYQRPRRFYAQTEKDEIDSTVKKWHESGVIVEADTNNPHCNQLTVAARRDLEGNIIKHRVCLDPRNLNSQLLESDNFPLPLIGDICNSNRR